MGLWKSSSPALIPPGVAELWILLRLRAVPFQDCLGVGRWNGKRVRERLNACYSYWNLYSLLFSPDLEFSVIELKTESVFQPKCIKTVLILQKLCSKDNETAYQSDQIPAVGISNMTSFILWSNRAILFEREINILLYMFVVHDYIYCESFFRCAHSFTFLGDQPSLFFVISFHPQIWN